MILKGTFLSKKAKEYFTKNWNKKVMSIAIGKAPINQEYETILNILTNGDLKKQLKKYGEEYLIHPHIIFILEDGSRMRYERLGQLTVTDKLRETKKDEWLIMDIRDLNLTLGKMIKNHLNFYKTDNYDKLIPYSPVSQNSQTFVRDFLKVNALLTNQMKAWFVQKLERIMKQFKMTNELVSKVIRLGYNIDWLRGNGVYQGGVVITQK